MKPSKDNVRTELLKIANDLTDYVVTAHRLNVFNDISLDLTVKINGHSYIFRTSDGS